MELNAAIVGIGTTGYGRHVDRTEREGAIEACWRALDDAGLVARDVDAVFQVDMQTGEPWELARDLGVDQLRAWASVGAGGGGAVGPVIQAALAVSSGMADVAIAYRARNRSTKESRPWAKPSAILERDGSFEIPYGLVSPAQQIAITARRYLHESKSPVDSFAHVAVVQREHAVSNPDAVFRNPITVEDVLSSRMISDPLHLLECCPETDGACAVVVTDGARARDLRQRPVSVAAVAQGYGRNSPMTDLYSDEPFCWPATVAAADIWRRSGLGPADMDVFLVYDMFAPVVLYGLEAYGFCPPMEAGRFVADGHIDGLRSTIPVNTHGGNLSEAFIHGFTHVLEGVRQLRGTSTSQVPGARAVLVAAAPVVPTTAAVLTS